MQRVLKRTKPNDVDELQIMDAVADLAAGLPASTSTEEKLLTVTFTATTLDQTLVHTLKGRHRGWTQQGLTSSNPQSIREATVTGGDTTKRLRLVATGPCTAIVKVWR